MRRIITLIILIVSVSAFAQLRNPSSTNVIASASGVNVTRVSTLTALQNFTDTNSYLVIEGDIDLSSGTETLPLGTTLVDGGGSLTNGTIRLNSGQIDGSLIHYSLDVEGGSLINTTYKWNRNNDGVTEGSVDSTTAKANTDNITKMFAQIKELNGRRVEIDTLDAFFSVWSNTTNGQDGYNSNFPIKLQPYTYYKLTENSFFRVFPTNSFAAKLFTAYKCHKTVFDGGNLIGDRWSHDYSPVNDWLGGNRDTHEYGANMEILGCHDFVLKNTYIAYGHGDGIGVGITDARGDGSGATPNGDVPSGESESKNVKIENVEVYQCRRNNISVTDVNGLVFENSRFIGAGAGFPIQSVSDYQTNGYDAGGVEPRCGADVEPYRERDGGTGVEKLYEIARNISFFNCYFLGNANTDLTSFKGDNIYVSNCYFDGVLNLNFGKRTRVERNFFKLNDTITGAYIGNSFVSGRTAITVNNAIVNDEGQTREIIVGNTIVDNDIYNYTSGINPRGKHITLRDNRVRDFTSSGIIVNQVQDGLIENNFIESDSTDTDGIRLGYSSWSKNLRINNNTIKVNARGIESILFNTGSDSLNNVYYNHNKITAPIGMYLEDTFNHKIKSNTFDCATAIDSDKNVSYIDLIGNRTTTNSDVFINHDGGDCLGWNVKRNDVYGDSASDIINFNGDRFDSADGVIQGLNIEDNIIRNNGTGDGIDISSNIDVTDNLILRNRFEPTAGTGVDIRYSGDDSSIFSNYLRNGNTVNTTITGTGNVTTNPQ